MKNLKIKLNRLKYYSFLFFIVFLINACGGNEENTRDLDDFAPSEADLFLSEFLEVLTNNAVTRYEVDWAELNSEVLALASDASTVPDLYPAVTRALELINTNHSFLLSPSGELVSYPSNLICREQIAFEQPSDSRIGYIRLDAFTPVEPSEARAKAESIQEQIKDQDSQDVVGWVVDLRDNGGGNMWPMLVGLIPFFDSQVLGHFIDADEQVSAWGVDGNGAFLDGDPFLQLDSKYSLINPLPKIAVLLSRRTASSGEAVAIAFKKQYNVAFFGSESCGLSTANQSFELRSGHTLFLTVSTIADREQEKYGERVSVDFNTTDDETINVATDWLLE